jgi:hypothetical protein
MARTKGSEVTKRMLVQSERLVNNDRGGQAESQSFTKPKEKSSKKSKRGARLAEVDDERRENRGDELDEQFEESDNGDKGKTKKAQEHKEDREGGEQGNKTTKTSRKQTPQRRPSPGNNKPAPKGKSVKKPFRHRPGTVALREIRKYQKSTGRLLLMLPFNRLVRQIAAKLYPNDEKLRFQSTAILALLEVSVCVFPFDTKYT